MSRQNARITRWLMGIPEPASSTEDAGSGAITSPATQAPLPPLPVPSPGSARPRVQGLQPSTRDVRRQQLGTTFRDAGIEPVPDALHALRDDLAHLLESLATSWEGFHSAVLATASGAWLAHAGLTAEEAESLALATSRMSDGLGLPAEDLDVAAVSLRSGHIVVVARTPHHHGDLLLRVTSQATAMGLAIVQAQRAAKEIAAL